MARKTTMEQRRSLREQQILAAAAKFLAVRDWESITIDEIADEADIAKGSVYAHFQSKEELFARLSLAAHEELLQRLDRLRGSPVEDLKHFVQMFFEAHSHSEQHYRIMQFCQTERGRQNLSADTDAAVQRRDEAFHGSLSQILADGVAAGAFLPSPIPLLMYRIQAVLFGCIPMIGETRLDKPRPAQCLAEVTNLILAGVSAGAVETEVSDDTAQGRRSKKAKLDELLRLTGMEELHALQDDADNEGLRVRFMQDAQQLVGGLGTTTGLTESTLKQIDECRMKSADALTAKLLGLNTSALYAETFGRQVSGNELDHMLDYYRSAAGQKDVLITRRTIQEIVRTTVLNRDIALKSQLETFRAALEAIVLEARRRTDQRQHRR